MKRPGVLKSRRSKLATRRLAGQKAAKAKKRKRLRQGRSVSRGTSLPAVSDRRQDRRDALGARGPLCDEAKRLPCFECRKHPTDPAHLDRVGQGYGDWIKVAGAWRGRVAPACRGHHRIIDRNVVGWSDELEQQRAGLVKRAAKVARRLGIKWAAEHGIKLNSTAPHPYVQLAEKGGGGAADILD